jgi:hypothetical protein
MATGVILLARANRSNLDRTYVKYESSYQSSWVATVPGLLRMVATEKVESRVAEARYTWGNGGKTSSTGGDRWRRFCRPARVSLGRRK